MSEDRLFRKEAVEKYAAVADLETRMVLVARPIKLAATCLFALLVALVIWSFVDRVPDMVTARGILLPQDGVHAIYVPKGGIIQNLDIAAGTYVADNQKIAEVRSSTGLTEVLAQHAGRVAELLVDDGEAVSVGQPIVTIIDETSPIVAAIFVPAADGKRVEIGMQVRIQSANTQAGHITGTVIEVGVYPQSQAAMMRRLKNARLTEVLTSAGATTEVLVEIDWSAYDAAQTGLATANRETRAYTVGALTNASIILDTKPPIAFLFPALQGWVSK